MRKLRTFSMAFFVVAALSGSTQSVAAAGCEYTDYPLCDRQWQAPYFGFTCQSIVFCEDIYNCMDEICPGQWIGSCSYESGAVASMQCVV